MLPLLLTAVADGWLAAGAARWRSRRGNAARIFGLPAKGRLAVGADADLASSSSAGHGASTPSTWLTRSRGTAAIWDGREVRGRVVRTYVRGQLVWDAKSGLIGEPGWGRWVQAVPLGRLSASAGTCRYGSALIIPPSTGTISAPVTYDAAGESRNAPTRPISATSP